MPRIMPWNRVSTARRSRSDSDEQPKASTTHSIPLMPSSPLSLRLSTFRAELAGARDGLAALAAKFCGRRGSARRCRRRSSTATRSRGCGLLHGVHHRLAHSHPGAESGAHANRSAAFIRGSNRNGLRHLILRELAHVAEHVHADALVEHFLKLFGKREIFDDEAVERKAVIRKRGLELLADFFGNRALAGGHIEKRYLAGCERIRHLGNDGVAQLAFEIGDAIEVARAADFRVESLRVRDVIGINSEAAEANRAELFVSYRDGILRAPVLVGLDARRKEIDIGFEGRLKLFVPVLQVGKNGKRVGIEGVESGSKPVRNFSFVHEHGELRIAHREFSAILDFPVLHRKTVSKNAVFGLRPIDDIDKLFGNKVAKTHEEPRFRHGGKKTRLADRGDATVRRTACQCHRKSTRGRILRIVICEAKGIRENPGMDGLWANGKAGSNRLKMANTAFGLGSIIPSNRVTKSLFQTEGGRYGRGDGRTTGIYQDGSSARRRIVGEPLCACTRCGGQRPWRGEKGFRVERLRANWNGRERDCDFGALGNGTGHLHIPADALERRARSGVVEDSRRSRAGGQSLQPSHVWNSDDGRKHYVSGGVGEIPQDGSDRAGDARRSGGSKMERGCCELPCRKGSRHSRCNWQARDVRLVGRRSSKIDATGKCYAEEFQEFHTHW